MKRITALIVAAFFVIYPVIPVMAVEITEAGEVCDFSVSEVCEVTEEDAYKETPSEYMEQPLFESAAAGNLWNGWEEFASDVYRPLGKGTKDEPYGIRNAGNMMWLSVNTAMGTGNISEAFYILQNDIDLSVVRSIAPDGDWNPIGWYLNKNSSEMYNAFKGSFDGNGYGLILAQRKDRMEFSI